MVGRGQGRARGGFQRKVLTSSSTHWVGEDPYSPAEIRHESY